MYEEEMMENEDRRTVEEWAAELTDNEIYEVTITADTKSPEFIAVQKEYWKRRPKK